MYLRLYYFFNLSVVGMILMYKLNGDTNSTILIPFKSVWCPPQAHTPLGWQETHWQFFLSLFPVTQVVWFPGSYKVPRHRRKPPSSVISAPQLLPRHLLLSPRSPACPSLWRFYCFLAHAGAECRSLRL